MFLLIEVIVTVFVFELVAATNYCDPKLCSNHIGCNNDGKFSSTCNNPVAIDITQARIDIIVNEHNKHRSKIASGQLLGFSSAVRMTTVQWDPELARLAALNVRQCVMRHDSCHATDKFKFSGQNLAAFGTTADKIDIDQTLPGGINYWFDEYKMANQSVIDKFNPSYEWGTQIGHFTALVHEKSNYVGCGVATYRVNNFNWFLLACNYSFTNLIDAPIYVKGPACSKCATGCNAKYPGLCNKNEVITY